MPELNLKEMYPGPWGIVEHRRQDIENAGYGGFERIVREELGKLFVSIDDVAKMMAAHASTARKWLKEKDPRYINRDGEILYHKEDAIAVVEHRKQSKIKKPKEPKK